MEKRRMMLFPAPVRTAKGTFWGYIDKKGEFAVQPIFQYAMDFQVNGLAVVEVNGQYGIINEFGKFVVKPSYWSISDFEEGRAIVVNDKGSFVMNEQGKLLTSKPYTYIRTYQESRAVFSIMKNNTSLYGYLDLSGKEIIPAQYQTANNFQNMTAIVQSVERNFKLIDQKGAVKQTYNYPFVGMQGEGFLAFKEVDSYDAKFGVMTLAGNVMIPPTYSGFQPFQNGLAVVNVAEDYTNKFGVINIEGKYVIQPIYNDVNLLGENRIAVGKAIQEDEPFRGSMFAVATSRGALLTDFEFTQVLPYEKGFASASNNESTFFINRSGKVVQSLPILKGSGTLSFEGDIIKANVDLRISYYTLTGQQIWKQNTVIPLSRKYKVLEGKFRPNQNYLVYYPQVEGMQSDVLEKQVNQQLRNLSMSKESEENLANSEYTADFDIEFFKKQLLVLELHSYIYPFGAAHGMPSKVFPHIDLQTGVFYQLKDLFKENSDYVTILSAIIQEQIKTDEQYSYVFPDAYKGISPDQPFYVSEEALYIYFLPYEIVPYAAGFPTFKIPYTQLETILYKEGLFWKSFH
ncbi:WG repeat-containing protein [Bacillus suaedaesalsae]|uniref:WG repeat-containing protein n=1 Tax=Bacillus suaedaesalsae TaxID=2810349 RepID=A0ABS2DDK2_9BACI|nr:WG repeat-containing protein [Bacillus suaedaesalsae]MBM6616527.1 WG repeat-containing protein [Bacillus suaedaesalsae]